VHRFAQDSLIDNAVELSLEFLQQRLGLLEVGRGSRTYWVRTIFRHLSQAAWIVRISRSLPIESGF
jgi:hypothetical protein